MNATDIEDRIRAGFADLLEKMRANLDEGTKQNTIRRNTEGRERAQERLRREYAAFGMLPPSDFALSVTARWELGIGVEYPHSEAAE